MAQTRKQTKKELIKFLLTHPIKTAKIMLAMKKATDIELVAVWFYSRDELQKRGIK